MNYKHLEFREIITTGVTRVYKVYSKHDGTFLGTLKWRVGWRCYVMSWNECDMSRECDEELDDFWQSLINERNKRLGILNQEKLKI